MKRIASATFAALALAALSPAAYALGDCSTGKGLFCPKDSPTGPTSPVQVSAPEIDVNAGAKGVALLVAGLLLLGEGLRRRR